MKPRLILNYILCCLGIFLPGMTSRATNPTAPTVTVSPSGPYIPTVLLTGGYTYFDADGNAQDVPGTFIGWYQSNFSTGSGAALTGVGSTFSATTAYRGKYIAFGVIPKDVAGETGILTFSSWHLVNALPQGTDDNYINQSAEGAVLTIAAPGVLSNDNSGGDGQSITAVVLANPSYGVLVLNANGSFTYTHDGSENLTDSYTYRVYDGLEYSTATTVHLQVTAVNDAPVFSSTPVTTGTEDVTYTYNITTTDAENNNRTISSTGILPDGLALTDINTVNGTARLTGTPTNGGTYPVTLRVTDASAYTEQAFSIVVTNVNDAPVLSAIEGTALQYAEEEAAKIITSTILITDVDNETLASAEVSISGGLVTAEDRLILTALAPLSATYDQGTGVMTITGVTTKENYQNALRSVKYSNINTANPNTGNRTVSFKVNDGSANSNTVTRTIQITAVNDLPVAVADNYTGVLEGGTLTTTLANGVLFNDTDLDGPSAMTATRVTNVGFGTLTFNSNGTFTYVHNGSNNLSDIFTYYAYDGIGNSATVEANISMTPVNDPPVLSGVPTDTLEFTEDDLPRTVAPLIQVTDEDNTTLASATIRIDQGFVVGEDSLVFSAVPGLTIVYDTLTGILTATGTATLAVYQNSLLRNIKYWNTNKKKPNTQYRRVAYTVSDGTATSAAVRRVIKIIPWNDPPVATLAHLIGTNFYVDQLVTIDYTYSDPDQDPEGNTTFGWYTATNTQGTGWAQIMGWNTDTFTTRFSEGGKYLKAIVTPFDNKGLAGIKDTSEWRYINAAPELLNYAVVNPKHPGAFAVGQTVKASFTYSDKENNLAGVHTYQWYRSNTGSWLAAQTISGATKDSFLITSAENNKYIGLETTPKALTGSSPGQKVRSSWYLVSQLPSGVLTGGDSICSSNDAAVLTVTLTGNNAPWAIRYTIDGSGDTTTISGIPLNQSIYTFPVKKAGTYRLVAVSDTKYDFGVASGTAVVAFYSNPSANLLDNEVAICTNDLDGTEVPIRLTGKLPWRLSYRYSGDTDSTTIINIDTAYVGIGVTSADLGQYTLLHVWDKNCMAKATGIAQVIKKDNPTATMEGDTSVCPGSQALLSVDLTGNGPWTFYYTKDGGSQVAVNVNQNVSSYSYKMPVLNPGLYKLVKVVDEDDEGCAFGLVNVQNYILPTANITGTKRTCEGTAVTFDVTLTGAKPWNISYRLNTQTPVPVSGINASPYKLSATKAGNYTITSVTDAHCQGTGTGVASLTVDPLPLVSIVGMDTIFSIDTDEQPVTVAPYGGNFSLSDDSRAIINDDGQWYFYPSLAYVLYGSPFRLRYSYADPVTTCVGTDEHRVLIIQKSAEIQIDNEKEMYCFNDDPFEILGINILRNIGTFSISGNQGLVDMGNNKALVFPDQIQSGQKTITYTVEIYGETKTDQKTLSFNKINGDFTWDNECYSDHAVINFSDASSSSYGTLGWNWNFYLPDDTLVFNQDHASVEFNDLNSHNIEYIVSASYNEDFCYDTVHRPFSLKPTFDVYDMPYDESFTSGEANWNSFTPVSGGLNSWRYGTPSGSIWSGLTPSKSWYTNITDLTKSENSYIISPCYDFTRTQRPMIKLDLWRDFTQVDGAVLQYTINNGKNWTSLGTLDDGINWYNAAGILGLPGGQGLGWTDVDDGKWINARHKLDIPELMASDRVRFRIAYGAPSGVQNLGQRGLAVDDIWIGDRQKKVLYEHFTNNADESCAEINPSLNTLFNAGVNNMDIIDIQYHLGEPDFGPDIFYNLNPYAPESRRLIYGIQSVPYGVIDGGRGNKPEYLINYDGGESLTQKDLTLAALDSTLFDIDVQIGTGSSSMDITARVRANETIAQKELTLHVVVIENVIVGVVGNNGENSFESVFKTMLPDATGTSINHAWSVNEEETYNFNYNYENVYSDSSLRVVAFIQDLATKHIYQAEMVTRDTHTGINHYEAPDSHFSLYPNPASQSTFIRFEEVMMNTLELRVFDINGRLIMNDQIYPGASVYEFPLDNMEQGIYLIRVYRDDHMLGTEKLIKLGNNF
jgi:VCBS repeat-containing protein